MGRNHLAAALLAGSLCLVPCAAGAVECDEYSLYLHLVGGRDVDGVATDLALAGDLAYLADPFMGAVYVMDVTDPASPVLVRTVGLAVNVQAATVSSGHLFLATTDGLTVLDLADPADPQPLGQLPLSSPAVDVVVDGTYAYVAERTVGMQVVDVSDPSAPDLLHTVPGHTREIALQGDHAYLAAGPDGIRVVDISGPESAAVVGSLTLPGTASGIGVRDDHAFVTVGSEGLLAVRVANPAAPELVGSLDFGPLPALSVDIAGDFAIVFGHDDGMFYTVDLTEPDEPALIDGFGGGGYAARFRDGLAYIAHGGAGLTVHDVGNPAARDPLGTAPVDPYGQDLAAGQGLLFVGTGLGPDGTLQVFSLGDPEQPALEATLPLPFGAAGVAARGSFALVHGDFGQTDVLVVDATVPTAPQVVDVWSFESMVVDIVVGGDRAYVLHHLDPPQGIFGSRLQVVDIADPAGAVFRGAVLLPEAVDLAIDGPRGVVASNLVGGWPWPCPVVLLDLADPDAPAIYQLIDNHHPAPRVAIRGYLVLVAEQPGPLPISRQYFGLDLHLYPPPGTGEPRLLGSGQTFSAAGDILPTGFHVFAAGQVLDISDLSRPTSMGATYGIGRAMVAAGGLIYAAGPTSLTVFPPQCQFVVEVADDGGAPPAGLPVLTVQPNPFNPLTRISFHLERPGRVQLAVFDLAGRMVVLLADRGFDVGDHSVIWDGRDAAGRAAASGAYVVRWEGDGIVRTRKVLLAR